MGVDEDAGIQTESAAFGVVLTQTIEDDTMEAGVGAQKRTEALDEHDGTQARGGIGQGRVSPQALTN